MGVSVAPALTGQNPRDVESLSHWPEQWGHRYLPEELSATVGGSSTVQRGWAASPSHSSHGPQACEVKAALPGPQGVQRLP